MKVLHLEISNCQDCPHCFYHSGGDYYQDMYYCDRLSGDAHGLAEATDGNHHVQIIIPPDACPLPDKEE